MLSEEILQRLAAADRSFQRRVGATFLLRALKYLLAVLILLFGLDVALHLGARHRLLLDLAYLAMVLLVAGCAFYLAQIRRNKPEHVARMLERRDASLGSKLINLLQLGQQIRSTEQPELTRALAEQAIGTYLAELRGRDFTPLAKSPQLKRDLRAASIGLFSFGALLAVLYPVSKVELARFLDPFGDHPPYSWTQIEIVEPGEGMEVNYNGRVVVKVKTTGHTPSDLFLSFGSAEGDSTEHGAHGAVTTLPMFNKGDAGFYQAIENIKTDLMVFAHTKDGHSISKKRRLHVILTPKFEKAFVEVAPPAYTGIAPREIEFHFKELTALAGSRIRFRIQSNRPLASGAITPARSAAIAMAPAAKNEDGNEIEGAMTAVDSTRLQFSLLDSAGNASQENPSAPLTVTYDLPPAISIDSPAQDGFICDDFKMEARISASDDYGIKTIRIHRALNEVFSAPKIISFDEITRDASATIDFDIKSLGVQPGDTLSLFAEAIDTCPEPHLTRTRTLRLTVISTDEYNDYLRERSDISDIQGKYSALLNQFHDLLDEQKQLSQSIDELQKKQAEPGAEKDLQEKIEKLMAKQAELNKKLGALAERMEHFVREKPLYDLESELQANLNDKAAKIRASLGENDQALKENLQRMAENGGNKPNQMDALDSLQRESQKQVEALEPAHKQAVEETLPPLKDAALMNALLNDFNAVKYLHEVQTTTASEAKVYESRPVTTDEDKLALKQLAGTERQVQQALDKIIGNLRRHADEAEQTFPKAAQSARDLAARMEKQRFTAIAEQAVRNMLAGKGADSYSLAERLRQELSDLFEDEESGEGGAMCKEFDKHLKLQRRMNAGNTFQQMAKSRKFGIGMGNGATGSGQDGMGGIDGYSTSSSSNAALFGNEMMGGDSKAFGSGAFGQAGVNEPGQKVDLDKADSVPDLQGVNRPTGENRSELSIDEYRSVIDAYFNSITQ